MQLTYNAGGRHKDINEFIKKKGVPPQTANKSTSEQSLDRQKTRVEGIVDTLTGASSGVEIAFKRDDDDTSSSQSEEFSQIEESKEEDDNGLAQLWLKKLEKRPLSVQVDITDLKPVYLARKDIGEKKGGLMSVSIVTF